MVLAYYRLQASIVLGGPRAVLWTAERSGASEVFRADRSQPPVGPEH